MATNLWENPSLEDGIAGWSGKNGASVSQSSDYASDGTYSLKETGGNVYAGIQCANREIIDASTQYTLHYEVYSTAADLDLSCRVVDQDGNWLNEVTPTIASSATWTQVTNTFTTGAGDTGIYWWVHKLDESASDIFYVDKIMLETGGSASTWVDYSSVDVVQSPVGAIVATGYDPTVTATDTNVDVVQSPAGAIVATGYNPVVTAVTGQWEIGAYIYSTVGGVQVIQSSAGGVAIQGYDHVVSGPSVPTDVEQDPAGIIYATGFNPTVTATSTTGAAGNLMGFYLRRILKRRKA